MHWEAKGAVRIRRFGLLLLLSQGILFLWAKLMRQIVRDRKILLAQGVKPDSLLAKIKSPQDY